MLCQACRSVLLRTAPDTGQIDPMDGGDSWTRYREGLPTIYLHHETLGSLLAAVGEKCLVCWTFWYGLSPGKRSECSSGDRSLLAKDVAVLRSHLMTRAVLSDPGDSMVIDLGSVSESSHYFQLSRLSNICAPVLSSLLRGGNASNELLLSDQFTPVQHLIQKWIRRCMSDHLHCRQNEDRNGWHPTRLLDVSRARRGLVKLVNTASLSHEWPYITLSHRWGTAQFHKLTVETEPELRKGITLSKLPKTFQDAICVAYRLGTRYLWIDSLCILQDEADLTDWKRESALMQKVYGYSHCNLSATGALDPSEGLFPDVSSEPPAAEVAECMATNEDGLSRATETRVIAEENMWWNSVESMPLNNRGWVLQERLLANRVLHFGRKQLLWECSGVHACELFSEGIPTNNAQDMPTEIYRTGFKALSPTNKADPIKRSMVWRQIVEQYSVCQLTKPEDKLVAIAGIAKHLSKISEDDYLVGLWRSNLLADLFWCVREGILSRRRADHRAPSWSWASIDGAIEYPCRLTDEIRGRIKDVALSDTSGGPMGLLHVDHILLECTMNPLAIVIGSSGRFITCCVLNRSFDVFINWDDAQWDLEADNDQGVLYCVHGPYNDWGLYLLILRCEYPETATFSRVGMAFYLNGLDDDTHWLQTNDSAASSWPCVEYNEETRMHTIRLI